jgi:hypothetical protein
MEVVTPFQLAAKGDLEGLQRAIADGFDLFAVDEDWGWSVLGWAAKYGQIGIVEWLLDLNVPWLVDFSEVGGYPFGPQGRLASPLHLSCESQWTVFAEKAAAIGEDAARLAFRQCVGALIVAGADVHFRDVTGNTPYSRAMGGDAVIIEMLAKAGCGEADLMGGSVEATLVDMIRNQYEPEVIADVVERHCQGRKVRLSPFRTLAYVIRSEERLGQHGCKASLAQWYTIRDLLLAHNRGVA